MRVEIDLARTPPGVAKGRMRDGAFIFAKLRVDRYLAGVCYLLTCFAQGAACDYQ